MISFVQYIFIEGLCHFKIKSEFTFIKHLLALILFIELFQVYNDAVKKARDEFSTFARPAGLLPPCSTNLQHVHYTFDFSQALSIPHHARQEGPLYFLTPRKVQLFGVALEGCYQQVNYIVDEDQGMGENGAGVKGSNGVISMLHHCLTTFGSGEKECIIHCDNCAGTLTFEYVVVYAFFVFCSPSTIHHDFVYFFSIKYSYMYL